MLLRRVVLATVLSLLAAAAPASATTFRVNDQADAVDAAAGDGVCRTAAGKCTLRAAVQQAGAGDTVAVPAGTYNLTIAGASATPATGDLDVAQNLTVERIGRGQVKIDAGAIASRIFDVPAVNASLTLRGLTLTRGNAAAEGGFGGAVRFDSTTGTLTVADSTFADNLAQPGGGFGGAIFAASPAGLQVAGSRFTGNRASQGSGAGSGFGGAIFADPATGVRATIDRSTFVGNTAVGGGGGFGGAVFMQPAGTASVRIANSTFTGNIAGGAVSGAGGSGFGGAVFIQAATGALSFDRIGLTSNKAGGGTKPGFGGGFYVSQAANAQPFLARDVSASGNSAGGGSSGTGFGGTAFVEAAANTTTELTRFAARASAAGGGGNGATGYGGGVYATAGVGAKVTLTDVAITDSRAGSGGPTSSGFGGGAYVTSDNNSTLTWSGVGVGRNTAGGDGAAGYGGGIYATAGDNSVSRLTNTTIASNTAGGGAGGDGFGGGLFGGAGMGTTTLLTNLTVSSNKAMSSGIGGNLYLDGTSSVRNTIVADGAASSDPNCRGAASGGHNIVKGTSCGFAGVRDRVADPRLGAFRANGGFSSTMAIPLASPAINTGNPAHCPTTDQRGVRRPQRSGCDIGAFENRPPTVAAAASASRAERTVPVRFTATPAGDPSGALTFEWTFDDGGTARGQSVTHAFTTTGRHTATVRMSEAGGGTVQATVPVDVVDTAAPGIGSFSMSRRKFAVGSRPTTVDGAGSRRRVRTGTTFRFAATEAGRARIAFTRARPGRRVRGRCVKKTRRNRRARRCTRFVRAGALTRTAKVGANRVKFTGRVGRRKLKVGRYRATITLTDASGNRSKRRTVGFRVVKPPR